MRNSTCYSTWISQGIVVGKPCVNFLEKLRIVYYRNPSGIYREISPEISQLFLQDIFHEVLDHFCQGLLLRFLWEFLLEPLPWIPSATFTWISPKIFQKRLKESFKKKKNIHKYINLFWNYYGKFSRDYFGNATCYSIEIV